MIIGHISTAFLVLFSLLFPVPVARDNQGHFISSSLDVASGPASQNKFSSYSWLCVSSVYMKSFVKMPSSESIIIILFLLSWNVFKIHLKGQKEKPINFLQLCKIHGSFLTLYSPHIIIFWFKVFQTLGHECSFIQDIPSQSYPPAVLIWFYSNLKHSPSSSLKSLFHYR